jgi:sugar PTS system EIIA component
VKLKGDGFTVHAAEGDTVSIGDLIVTVDLGRMNELGIDLVSPVVVISGQGVTNQASGEVQPGDRLFDAG